MIKIEAAPKCIQYFASYRAVQLGLRVDEFHLGHHDPVGGKCFSCLFQLVFQLGSWHTHLHGDYSVWLVICELVLVCHSWHCPPATIILFLLHSGVMHLISLIVA